MAADPVGAVPRYSAPTSSMATDDHAASEAQARRQAIPRGPPPTSDVSTEQRLPCPNLDQHWSPQHCVTRAHGASLLWSFVFSDSRPLVALVSYAMFVTRGLAACIHTSLPISPVVSLGAPGFPELSTTLRPHKTSCTLVPSTPGAMTAVRQPQPRHTRKCKQVT